MEGGKAVASHRTPSTSRWQSALQAHRVWSAPACRRFRMRNFHDAEQFKAVASHRTRSASRWQSALQARRVWSAPACRRFRMVSFHDE